MSISQITTVLFDNKNNLRCFLLYIRFFKI